MTPEKKVSDLGFVDEDPLVGRLRSLEWSEVPTTVRERCWQQISGRIADIQAVQDPPHAVSERNTCGERYAFSRRLAPVRVSVAQAWSRRASYRPALVA
ncbi:MAG TPA: hypothetical protein VGN69_02460 [Solirubrobacteraceae bacterium]|jgi:hypothetical protein|nr:hypothetical protein [Solirubrobacteraceae bacterium]